MVEAKVKSYTRKTKSGKTVQVRAHSRKCKGGSCADKQGSGDEIYRIKKSKSVASALEKHLSKVKEMSLRPGKNLGQEGIKKLTLLGFKGKKEKNGTTTYQHPKYGYVHVSESGKCISHNYSDKDVKQWRHLVK